VNSSNVDRIFGDGWDCIVDGCDNFPTRYLVNDASLFHKIPVVHGSIFRFDGPVTTFMPFDGPCYRCLYPEPPPAHLAPSCAEAGRARHPARRRRRHSGDRGDQADFGGG
jgi:molybdopterin/thiamine biosynthesis adenylyltransferase